MSNVEGTVPRMEELVLDVNNKHRKIENFIANNITVSLASIRYKIDWARSLANGAKLAMKFNGTSVVTLDVPNNLQDPKTRNSIDFTINPSVQDGLVLFIGDGSGQSRRRRQTSSIKKDYLAVELRNGKILFLFRMGGKSGDIEGPLLAPNNWYKITVSR